jgi:hypothetical protein
LEPGTTLHYQFHLRTWILSGALCLVIPLAYLGSRFGRVAPEGTPQVIAGVVVIVVVGLTCLVVFGRRAKVLSENGWVRVTESGLSVADRGGQVWSMMWAEIDRVTFGDGQRSFRMSLEPSGSTSAVSGFTIESGGRRLRIEPGLERAEELREYMWRRGSFVGKGGRDADAPRWVRGA